MSLPDWGDWALDADMNVRQVKQPYWWTMGSWRVILVDPWGRDVGPEDRRNLKRIDFTHFETEGEKRLAAQILQEAKDTFYPSTEVHP